MPPRPWRSLRSSQFVVGVLVVVVAFGATAAGAGARARSSGQGADPSGRGAEPASGASYLWSQDASGGSLRGPSDDELTLELRGLRRYVTRFTDHPARDAAIAANRDFYARWDERFALDPPNGVLTYRVEGEPQPVSIVLTLSDPKFDAKNGSVRYAAVRIRKQPDTLPGTSTELIPPVIPNPRSFGAASLFIDSGSASSPGLVINVASLSPGAVLTIKVPHHRGIIETRTSTPLVDIQLTDDDSIQIAGPEGVRGASALIKLRFCVPLGTSTTAVDVFGGSTGEKYRFYFLGPDPVEFLDLTPDAGGHATGSLTVPPDYQLAECPA